MLLFPKIPKEGEHHSELQAAWNFPLEFLLPSFLYSLSPFFTLYNSFLYDQLFILLFFYLIYQNLTRI